MTTPTESEYVLLLEKKHVDPLLMLDEEFRNRLEEVRKRWLEEQELVK